MAKLTAKQEMFAQHVASGKSQSEAYRLAYNAGNMKPAVVDVTACKLAKNAKVALRVTELQAPALKAAELTIERVMKEVSHAAFPDPCDLFADNGTLLPLRQMPEHARRAIAGIEVEEIYLGKGADRHLIGYLKKIKLVSKEGTLNLAGRRLKAWNDVGSKDNPLQAEVSDMGEIEKAARIAALLAKARERSNG